MAFEFRDEFVQQYATVRWVIFRGILPASLIRDLRKEADKGRAIARELRGQQAQRLQPIGRHLEKGIDPRPFQDYRELPALNEAVRRVLGRDDAWYGDINRMAVFYEPADSPCATHWHRDITAESAKQEPADFRYYCARGDIFNQINCALYDDTSTWYVPGSGLRGDLPGEKETRDTYPDVEKIPCHVARETAVLDYARHMPRAINAALNAGDFLMYDPNGWHIGVYAPYRIRCTLHDTVYNADVEAWYEGWYKRLAADKAKA